ncbi:hypothetical protein [Marinobacter sp. bablab_jr008]|uniref:hypothetical protein n=1 Tax=Marinobacter TaxID=2742 RepID=UPI0018F23468|nr:hypothetical protein [Marinobacter sp. bablab_jr008]MEC9040068.1 hypothetical protein [Pseudomonadota bacterium]
MYYQSSKNAFLPDDMIELYALKEGWPEDELPADVIEVTDSEWLTYGLSSPPPGMQRGPGEDGRPTWVPTPSEEDSVLRNRAIVSIDTAAGNARSRYVSAGQLVEQEYRLALQQVEMWRQEGSPSENVPPAVKDWAEAEGISFEIAAASIEQTAADWEQVLITIRRIRLAGKASVKSAPDGSDFSGIAQPFIDQLNAMEPT